jgi:hypothetical protein
MVMSLKITVIALMMEAVLTSETLVFFETKQIYIPESSHLQFTSSCYKIMNKHIFNTSSVLLVFLNAESNLQKTYFNL